MSITYILLSVSIACNVWFVLLLLADRIADTKAVRLLRGIADVWKSLHETSEERPTKSPSPVSDNEIIGKSKFRMQPSKTTAATPVPKESTYEKGVEMSENDIILKAKRKAVSEKRTPPASRTRNLTRLLQTFHQTSWDIRMTSRKRKATVREPPVSALTRLARLYILPPRRTRRARNSRKRGRSSLSWRTRNSMRN